VTVETMPVIGGSVAVPRGPGLGVTLDREKLERYKKPPTSKAGRFLVRARYASGLTIYSRHAPDAPGALAQLVHLSRRNVPGPAPSYGNAVVTDFWDEANSADFERIWKQTATGPIHLQDK
jgi:hypothetical protein